MRPAGEAGMHEGVFRAGGGGDGANGQRLGVGLWTGRIGAEFVPPTVVIRGGSLIE